MSDQEHYARLRAERREQYQRDHPELGDGTGTFVAEIKEPGDTTGFPRLFVNFYDSPNGMENISLYVIPVFPPGSDYNQKIKIAEALSDMIEQSVCRFVAFLD